MHRSKGGNELTNKLDSLERLQRLRDAGALNNDEFEMQKSYILNNDDGEIENVVNTKTTITEYDVNIANSIRGKRRFSFLSGASIIFLLLIFAITNDFYGYEYGSISIIIYVILIIAVSLIVDLVYRYVPTIAILFVSLVFFVYHVFTLQFHSWRTTRLSRRICWVFIRPDPQL